MTEDDKRATARAIAYKFLGMGKPLDWFEELYLQAGDNPSIIPWADLTPNPSLVDWLDRHQSIATGLALKVGSGLGDDAEELSRRGFTTTAFDISPTAIEWSKRRFPGSSVSYVVADLFKAPEHWRGKFNFVCESYTLQVLPPELRADAIRFIVSFVAPGGTLLVIARGREPGDSEGKMPWPIRKDELAPFQTHGMEEVLFEDFVDGEDPPVHRFRVTYRRVPADIPPRHPVQKGARSF